MITRTFQYKHGTRRMRVVIRASLAAESEDGFRPGERFAVTATVYQRGVTRWLEESSGIASKELIERFAPDLLDIYALHLCDIEGAPLHAESNALYFACGAMGGLGQTYHAGNGPWPAHQAECLSIFANMIRVPLDVAATVLADLRDQYPAPYDAAVIAGINAYVAAQRPRWAMEAGACISKHAQEHG